MAVSFWVRAFCSCGDRTVECRARARRAAADEPEAHRKTRPAYIAEVLDRPKDVSMRPLALALAITLTSALHAQSQPLRIPVTVDTLPNGLTVIVHEDHSVPIASVNIWYHVGSGDE